MDETQLPKDELKVQQSAESIKHAETAQATIDEATSLDWAIAWSIFRVLKRVLKGGS